MTKTEWAEEIYPLIAQAAKIDPIRAENHPAFRGAIKRIDNLIEAGLEHGFLSPEEAARA